MTGRKVTPSATLVFAGPANTPAWLEARRRGVGASDVPIIVGAKSRDDATVYKTPLEVYHDKRGDLPFDEAGEAAQWGHLLEDPVAREWARREDVKVRRVGIVAHHEHPWRRASLDRLVTGCVYGARCFLEVKTRSAYASSDWTDGLPDDVLAQVQWQLHVTGLDHAHVATLLGGQRLKSYTVWPEPELADYLVREVSVFWQGVLDGRPPETDPSALLLDLLDRLHPNRAGSTVVDDDTQEKVKAAWRDYQDALDRKKAAEADSTAARARAAELLGDAEELAAENYEKPDKPIPLVTWRQQNTPRRVDLDLLRGKYPDAYQETVTQGTTRVLRFGPGAKA